MFEEKEYKTNDRPVSHSPSRASSRTNPTLPPSTASSKPSASPVDDGDLLMRRKIDPDCDVVVLDVGTHTIKAGWAGEDSPRCVVPAVVVEVMQGRRGSVTMAEKRSRGGDGDDGGHGSHHRYASTVGGAAAPHEVHVGAAAIAYLSSLDDNVPASSLHISRPLSRSLLASPDALIRLLEHVFTAQLHISPKDHAVLLAYSPLLPAADRAHLASLLFAHFHCPALLPVNAASLALFSAGRTTGLVLDVGEGRSTVVPVYEGFVLSHAILTQRVGGEDCTAKLASMLRERGKTFGWGANEVVRDMKEKLCKVRSKAVANSDSSNKRAAGAVRLSAAPITGGSGKTSDASSVTSTPKATAASLASRVGGGAEGSGGDENTYELPSGEMIELDDECVHEAMEVLFTGAGQGEGSSHSKADESVSWAVGVKADDELDGGSSNQLSLSSAAGSRIRSSANTYRHNSANGATAAAAAASTASLPPHLSSLSALTRDGEGLPALVASSLGILDAHLRATLVHAIVLAGGVSMSGGIGERVRREVEALLGSEVSVVCDSQRMYGAWVGGSMFGSLSTFGAMKVTADAYKKDESIMNKRFL